MQGLKSAGLEAKEEMVNSCQFDGSLNKIGIKGWLYIKDSVVIGELVYKKAGQPIKLVGQGNNRTECGFGHNALVDGIYYKVAK